MADFIKKVLAEETGFEPAEGLPLTCFRDRRNKPGSATPLYINYCFVDNTNHLFR